MKRALMYASVASMILQFNMKNIKLLKELGYEVDVACNMVQGSSITPEKIEEMKKELAAMGVRTYHIPVPRKITAIGEILNSLKLTKALINEREYELIHCHSPIGSMICRLANRFSLRYKKAKMIYTAHGFHFFKGAPTLNWLLFYPAEKLCARFTDILITINREDYDRAKRRLNAKEIKYVKGVGISPEKFTASKDGAEELRKELNIPENATVLLSVGELNENKNHKLVIRALGRLDNKNVYYVIVGKGAGHDALISEALKANIADRVLLLGFRSDVARFYGMANAFVFPSFREGLSVSLMEAMSSALPCAVSEIRGNTDLIDENGGTLFKPDSVDSCLTAINKLLNSDMGELGRYNTQKIQPFFIEPVSEEMRFIYEGASK